MHDSVPSARYSSVCNVLRQWRIWLIPTYRVYRLYDSVVLYSCERSKLSTLFNGQDFCYIYIFIYFRSYVVPVNVLNVSTCI